MANEVKSAKVAFELEKETTGKAKEKFRVVDQELSYHPYSREVFERMDGKDALGADRWVEIDFDEENSDTILGIVALMSKKIKSLQKHVAP